MKCDNPNCNNIAVVLYGTKMLCGDCLIKIQNIRRKKEEEYFNVLIQE